MLIPLLGREYAYPLLEFLNKQGKTTFTGLLMELSMSRATLSVTLQDLVDGGYIHKENLGKYRVYRLAENGSHQLMKRGGYEVLLERLALYIYDRMGDKGHIKNRQEADKEEILDVIKEKARQAVERVADSAAELLEEEERDH